MKRILAVSAAALALVACKPASHSGLPPAQAPAPAAAPADLAAVSDGPAPAAPPEASSVAAKASEPQQKPSVARQGPTAQAPSPAATPMLAYSYDYAIEAPAEKVRPLMLANEAECVAAGAQSCQITSANISEAGKDDAQAKLTFRATPAWLKGYEDRLGKAADGVGGRLTGAETTSEDLARQIVDTQGAIRAKTALRDRLQTMLETHSGSLDDLMTLQEKLTDAQTDLDSTTSELAVMQERVATSDVTIDYHATGVLAPSSAWSPISRALSSIAPILANSVAAIIYVVALVAPWALIVGGLLWIFRKRRPWRRKPSAPPAAPPSTPAS